MQVIDKTIVVKQLDAGFLITINGKQSAMQDVGRLFRFIAFDLRENVESLQQNRGFKMDEYTLQITVNAEK